MYMCVVHIVINTRCIFIIIAIMQLCIYIWQCFPEGWILVETTTLFYFWIHPEIASEMRTLLVLHGMSTQFLKNFHPVFNPTGNPDIHARSKIWVFDKIADFLSKIVENERGDDICACVNTWSRVVFHEEFEFAIHFFPRAASVRWRCLTCDKLVPRAASKTCTFL